MWVNIVTLADFLIFFTWGLLSFRFWQSFKRLPGKIFQFFFYFSSFLSISFFFIFLGDLLSLKLPLTIGLFFNILAFSCLGYLIFYLKFPNISSKYGFLIIFILGIITLSLVPFFPYLSGIDPKSGKILFWPHSLIGGLFFIIIIITTFPLGILFFQQGFSLKSPEEKKKAFGLGTILFLGLIVAFFYSLYFLLSFSLLLLFLVIIWAIIIISVTFFTQKPPSEKPKYTPPSYPKIQW